MLMEKQARHRPFANAAIEPLHDQSAFAWPGYGALPRFDLTKRGDWPWAAAIRGIAKNLKGDTMKRLLATFALLFASQAFGAQNLTGQWAVHISIAGNEHDFDCKLAEADKKITGTCGEQNVPVSGTVDGKNATWQYDIDYNGSPLTLIYTATLDDSAKIAGTVEAQQYNVTGDFTAEPASSLGASAAIPHNDEFVQHDGGKLTLGGEQFRYSGANIEWLGMENYGPSETMGPRYPTHFEVDDVLDTAKMMGARVIRSQTLGDQVGCDLCMEPKAGEFNDESFKAIDYAVKAAHDRGLRYVVTFIGDCTYCNDGGIGQFLEWAGSKNGNDFFTDPKLIAMFEAHIAALLNHKSTITGIALKDDPTIMAWENCNMCGMGAGLTGPDQAPALIKWVDTIGSYVKSIDQKHIYSDNSGLFMIDPRVLDAKTPDLVTAEYYPHFNPLFGGFGFATTADTFSKHAALVTAHGKAYSACEFGWDTTNWPTRDNLQAALTAMESDAKISGNGFWALYGHAIEYGWQPVVMPTVSLAHTKAAGSDTGQWWSLYYGGIDTLVNTRDDMRARAEMLRTHAFKMAGLAVPPHPAPATPVITTHSLGMVRWRGVAAAVNYSVERQVKDGAPWELVCDKCATDADMGWPDLTPGLGALMSKYRITAYNADGVASAPSAVR
jgi:hypothetical protein